MQLTSGSTGSGTLTVTDGTPATTANITLLGQYAASNFNIQTDGHGGTLVLDNEETPFRWRVRGWSEPSTGEISLCSRVDSVDTSDRSVRLTIRAESSDGRREEHSLTMRQWYRDELVPLFHDAGFASVDVLNGVNENTLVYLAIRQ